MADRSSETEWGVVDRDAETDESTPEPEVRTPEPAGDGSRGILGVLAKLLGGLVGGAVGGAAFTYLGYSAFVVGDTGNPVGGLAFIAGFIVAVFALAAPFALGKFLGSRLGGAVVGDLVYGAAFVLSTAFVVGLMFVGLYGIRVYDVPEILAVLVVFDAVTGVTAGAMGGYSVAEELLARRAAGELPA